MKERIDYLTLRVTEEERDLLNELAKKNDLKTQEFLRNKLFQNLERNYNYKQCYDYYVSNVNTN